MTKQGSLCSGTAAPKVAGAPDDVIVVSRSALMDGLIREMLEFFDDPARGGPSLHESEARWIALGGVDRALAGGLPPKP